MQCGSFAHSRDATSSYKAGVHRAAADLCLIPSSLDSPDQIFLHDKAKLAPILKGSLAFAKAIDEAAAAMYSLHQVMQSQGIKVQGVGREAYRS